MLFDVTTRFTGSLDAVVAESLESLQSHGFARVQGLFSAEEIYQARTRVEDAFSPSNDRKHDPRDASLLTSNFQKLVIGGTNGPNDTPRFVRMFYTPFMDYDQFKMHEIFRRLAMFRNSLYGVRDDFALHGFDQGAWSANRIQHYPRGGGFMAVHSDVGTAKAAEQLGLKDYVQVILIMSKKGLDFETGGAYILDHDKKRVFYEDDCEIGDVVIYDGRIPHGVEEIDYLSPLDMASPAGRYVAMTTVFRQFLDPTGREYSTLLQTT